ncbi:hypothetical protein BGZ70_007976 [Mortierella alpina]|uniref:Uncharacterized protein n=1 Tax=Mortierella alpina TaxID=64518 RepID=A0A9P6M6R1_MORAP|nr:hypothetical protein BGZ70_007976 [Mortierella alpina]
MQDFALARREHEQYYTIDWKYMARDRSLPSWPETREDMQTRLDRTLAHILQAYTASLTKDSDLSIVFVTHASPVNALLEACLQAPVLVPVPNCSISRCRWTPATESSVSVKDDAGKNDEEGQHSIKDSSLIPDVLIQSRQTQTIAQEQGRWLLDYQTHTSHLDRDRR